MKSRLCLVLLAALLILAPAAELLAARGCAENPSSPTDPSTYIETDVTANGQKYYGTITIYYEDTEVPGVVNMLFFARLGTGNEIWSFGGVEEDIPYSGTPSTVIPIQQDALESFVEETVIPFLYFIENGTLCDSGAGVTCPSFALKAVDNIKEDMLFTGSGLKFTIMDFTLAVQY